MLYVRAGVLSTHRMFHPADVPERIVTGGLSPSCTVLHDRDNDGDLDISGIDEMVDLLILFENR
jgi:hypothetical protein